MPGRALVLDANIIVRAVLGQRVRGVLELHSESISFFIPDVAFQEALEHLPSIVAARGGDPRRLTELFNALSTFVKIVGPEVYGELEAVARKRLQHRDIDDWPIPATALALIVRSGLKTRTSSAAESPHGPPDPWKVTFGSSAPDTQARLPDEE